MYLQLAAHLAKKKKKSQLFGSGNIETHGAALSYLACFDTTIPFDRRRERRGLSYQIVSKSTMGCSVLFCSVHFRAYYRTAGRDPTGQSRKVTGRKGGERST